MNCRQANRAIHARAENQPSEWSSAALDEHLAVCPRCRVEAEQVEALSAVLQASRYRAEPPMDMTEQIWAAVQEHRAQAAEHASQRRAWVPWRYSLAGAVVVLLALIAGSFFMSPHAPKSGTTQVARELTTNPRTPAPPESLQVKPVTPAKPADSTIRNSPAPGKLETVPKRKIRRRVIYYARNAERMIRNFVPAAENRHKVDTEPSREDYLMVARSLGDVQDIQINAGNEVKEQLEKTANVLTRVVGFMETAVEDSNPSRSEPVNGDETSSSHRIYVEG